MPTTTTVIIGAGPAGLAMSRILADRGVDHVVLERGEVGNAWKTERWDSLRLLTPNWMSRLPGYRYHGDDPDGFMTMPEVSRYFDDYALSFAAPVRTGTTVCSVRRRGDGYQVTTDQGTWRCRTVVLATGASGRPKVPAGAENLPGDIAQLAPTSYRNPDRLPPGRVLVVGASASGLQIADELQRAGRDVTLAVGSHTRLPRTYRGRDMQWWLDASGTLDSRYDQVADLDRARREPSLQLVGTPEHHTLDLGVLSSAGVRLTGRLTSIDGPRIRFADDLADTVARADRRLERLLDRMDAWASLRGLADLPPGTRMAPISVPETPRALDLGAQGISTVLWATGFRPHHPWLHLPVFDRTGNLIHDGGILASPGAYVLGLPFLRRRRSTFIDGMGGDADELADHLLAHLDATSGSLLRAS